MPPLHACHTHTPARDCSPTAHGDVSKLAYAATHTPNAVFVTDPAGTIEWMNASLTRLTGLTREATIGRHVDCILHTMGASPELVRDKLSRLDPFVFELSVPDGKARRWLMVSGQPSYDEAGAPTGWIVIGNDITDVRRAQETIEHRAQTALRYQSALQQLVQSDLSDLGAALRRITATTARALGTERASVWFLVGEPATAIRCAALHTLEGGQQPEGQVLFERDHPRYFAALRQHRAIDAGHAQTDGRTAEFAGNYLRAHDIQAMLDVPVWVDGVPVGVLCHEHVGSARPWTEQECTFATAAADIVALAVQTAERKRAEAALRAERDQSRRIIMGSPVIICGITPDGITTFINPAGERITGYPAAEIVGRNWWQTFYTSADLHDFDRIAAAIGAGDVYGYEKALTTRSGERLTIAWDSMNRYDETGRLVEIIGFGHDVTARRQMEAEQRAAREEAEAASRLKSEFLATVSHEIRTPLNGVIGMTGLLIDTPLAGEQRDYAETARRSAETLLSIINDILDFSKADAGKVTLDEVAFDIRTVIEDAIGHVAELAYGKGLEIGAIVSAGVPAELRGDAGRVRQVLANLLGNAVKFTSAGEVVVRAAVVETDPDSILLRVDVADTGIGLTREEQARIFHPFTQADGSTTRRYGGTGLGLAISKRVVELLQGEIGVSSAPDAGSTFWFTARFTTGAEHPPADEGNAALRGARLLVIDPHAGARAALANVAESIGAVVETAADGTEGLRRLRDACADGRSYFAAIASERLADMEGSAFAQTARADADICTAVVLAVAPGHVSSSEDAAASAILVKPVRQAQLRGALAALLDGAPPCAARDSAPTGNAAGDDSRRILVAEDNLVNQKVAVKLLEKLGYRVDVAVNGREAVKAAGSVPYAAIFMDCQMPEVDGYEATRLIRDAERKKDPTEGQRGGRIPIVAMTANALRGDRERCLAAGMDDYVSKPVSKESLQAVLQRWIAA